MDNQRIGLIAGSGRFPILFADKARQNGHEVFAAAFHNETDPVLETHVTAMDWLHLGQVGRLIRFSRTTG